MITELPKLLDELNQAERLIDMKNTLLAKRDQQRIGLMIALEAIANGRPDRLHCSQHDLSEVMRQIARNALAATED